MEITTREQASEVIRKVGQLRQKVVGIKEMAAIEISGIEGKAKADSEPLLEEEQKLMQALEAYHRSIYDESDNETKVIKLPFGMLKILEQPPQFKKDDKKLLEYMKSKCAQFVKVAESPNWAEFKKHLELLGNGSVLFLLNGETLDMVTHKKPEPKFYIETVVE